MRSIAPGFRISARVARRASVCGLAPPCSAEARSEAGMPSASFCSSKRRCSGVSWANASAWACSMVSGGAVFSM
jgi:hypothetical protein